MLKKPKQQKRKTQKKRKRREKKLDKKYSLWSEKDNFQLTTKISIAERDAKVKAFMQNFFDRAGNRKYKILDSTVQEELKQVFSSDIWGFREIILVIVIARLLNNEYRASVDLYACRPRALFEGPIRSTLRDYRVPHRQSGPLNIAKGTEKINAQWAAGRRPRYIADIVVNLVSKIESMSYEELENFAINLHAHFLEVKKESEALAVEIQPEANPDYLYSICEDLISNVPDGGDTPQKIVGFLLQSYHEILNTGILVSGHEDKASTTNTTSKKVGDITEGKEKGKALNIYEVSVKVFEGKRIVDAHSAARRFDKDTGTHTKEIIVLCREEDCHPDIVAETDTAGYFGKIEYQGILFYFQDLFEWIMAQLLRMPIEARLDFHTKLQKYISDYRTSLEVKRYWNNIYQTSTDTPSPKDKA
jgi:hypothetical protein